MTGTTRFDMTVINGRTSGTLHCVDGFARLVNVPHTDVREWDRRFRGFHGSGVYPFNLTAVREWLDKREDLKFVEVEPGGVPVYTFVGAGEVPVDDAAPEPAEPEAQTADTADNEVGAAEGGEAGGAEGVETEPETDNGVAPPETPVVEASGEVEVAVTKKKKK